VTQDIDQAERLKTRLMKANLCRGVALCQSSNLSFADHVHRLIALDSSLGFVAKLESMVARVKSPW
jgi:hypothetical protein